MSETETKVDLEKVRDEKCIPIAQSILEDLAEGLLPRELGPIDINTLTTKILARGRDADLNISGEASYVFQLVLGALSALNRTVQATKTIEIDDLRFFNIGRKILAIVAEAKVKLGSVTPEESLADFAPVQEKINALFAEEKLTMLEVKYVMDNVFDLFTRVNNLFSQSLEQSSERAEAKLFGLETMGDLTMGKLDAVLKEGMETKSA